MIRTPARALRFLPAILICVLTTLAAGPVAAACTDPPIPEVNYRDCTFDRQELKNVDLTGAQLRDSTFIRADLSGSTLQDIEGFGTKFNSATLTNVVLDGAKLYQADFSRADLTGASLVGADLRYVEFYNATLRNADLSDADLTHTDLTGADLSGATWTNGSYVCAEGSIGRCN